tara:strand:- start:3159 stop:4352 length:1194 start_codon:yes stop_codon:yes gene_type:complete
MKIFFLSDPKLLLFGFLLTFFSCYGQTFFISIFNIEIRSFYNLSDGEFGLIYGLATITSSFVLIWFAKLIDKIDLRIYSFLICFGLAIACLGMFYLIDIVLFLFLIIFFLRFFGQGAMGHASDTTMARYFDINRGKALAVGNLGFMFGLIVFPLIAVSLIKNFNWQFVWLFSSLSIIILCIPILIYSLWNQNIRHKEFEKKITEEPNEKNLQTRDIIKDKKFFIYLPISIATPFISTGLQFHQIFIMNQKMWTLDLLAHGYIFLGIFSVIGLIFGGPIIDKFNTKKVVLFSLMPLFFALIVLVFLNNNLSIFIYMSLLGLNLGISSPLIGALWAELWGLKYIGSIKAILHASAVFASALAPFVFGLLIDIGLGITSICILSLVIVLISTYLPTKYYF